MERPPVNRSRRGAFTTVVDFPSTMLVRGNLTAPTPGHAPSWMCTGCGTPACPGLILIVTSVVSVPGRAINTAVPDWSASRPGPRATVMVAPGGVTAGGGVGDGVTVGVAVAAGVPGTVG